MAAFQSAPALLLLTLGGKPLFFGESGTQFYLKKDTFLGPAVSVGHSAYGSAEVRSSSCPAP
jgi:hypothetical protein